MRVKKSVELVSSYVRSSNYIVGSASSYCCELSRRYILCSFAHSSSVLQDHLALSNLENVKFDQNSLQSPKNRNFSTGPSRPFRPQRPPPPPPPPASGYPPFSPRNSTSPYPRPSRPPPPPPPHEKSPPTNLPPRPSSSPKIPPKSPPKFPPKSPLKVPPTPSKPTQLHLPVGVTVRQLAKLLGQNVSALEEAISSLGENVNSPETPLSDDVAEIIALEFGRTVAPRQKSISPSKTPKLGDLKAAFGGEIEGQIEGEKWGPRPPVISVMGHVDHGKTTLLDALRGSKVAQGEAGGITQHLGASEGELGGNKVTFLDTPGHSAFQGMRERGARAMDLVVVVVAADDGVMTQTREALRLALSASAPTLIALTKVDKRGADALKVKTQLISEGVPLEEVGGEVQLVEVSSVTGQGLKALEETLLLQAELAGLRARLSGRARALVLEARVDKGKGPLAWILVQGGCLSVGDVVVAGAQWGKVRAIISCTGKRLNCAGPSEAVEISGFKGLPEAGDELLGVNSEERARQLAEARQRAQRLAVLERGNQGASGGELGGIVGEVEGEGGLVSAAREAVLVVKADVQGTLEAICQALGGLSCGQVQVKVVHSGVGPISQSDVALAEATGARALVAFNVGRAPPTLAQQMGQAKLRLVSGRVIYHVVEEVGQILVDLAQGTAVTQVSGQASVLQVFPQKSLGRSHPPPPSIAGCRISSGRISVGQKVRVLRSGSEVFEGICLTLRRAKKEVEKVGQGEECGLGLEGWGEFLPGDSLEFLEEIVVKPKLATGRDGGELRIVEG